MKDQEKTKEELIQELEELRARNAELKHAEQQLSESEDKYKRLVEGSPDILYIYSSKYGATYWSNRVKDILGYEPTDLIENPFLWHDSIHPDDLPRVNAAIDDHAKGKDFDIEYRIKDIDGNWHWFHDRFINKRQIKDEHIIEGLATDITDRKKAEQALKKSERLLQETGEMARVGGWELDVETKEVRWTKETYAIHEVPLDYKPDLNEALDFFHPSDREKLIKVIQRAMEFGEPYDLETRFITAKGKKLWTRSICNPYYIDGKTITLRGTFQDITERKLAEEALQESLGKYRVLFDSFPLGITISNEAGEIIETNKMAEQLLGISKEEQEQRSINGSEWKIIHSDGTKMLPEEYASVKALKENRVIENMEMGIVKENQSIIWLSVTAAPIPLKKYGVVVTYGDISDRKLAEKALKESEEKFRLAFENANVGVCLVDLKGRMIRVNEKMCDIFGYTCTELEQMTVNDFAHPDYKETSPTFINRAISGEVKNTIFEKKYTHKNGHILTCQVTSSLITDSKERPLYFISHIQDITDRIRIEQALKASEQDWRDSFNSLEDVMMIINKDYVVENINQSGLDLFGLSETEEAIGRKCYELVHREETVESHCSYCPFEKTLQSKKVESTDQYEEAMGRYFTIKCSPIFDKNGEIIKFVDLMQDITELKLIEQELREANAAKDKFFSIIAHDLKSPFSTLMSAAEHILKNMTQYPPEKTKDFIENIYRNATYLYKLVENLLQWSRTQSGRVKFEPYQFDLAVVLNYHIQAFQSTVAAKSIHLESEIDKNLMVYADTNMVLTIFRNLVSNALKFTPSDGKVKISAKNKEDMVEIAVSDSGVGISMENQAKLFRIDEHISTIGTDGERGTGLGLIICQEFVKKNGGEIWLESDVGKGSTFFFTLPKVK